jgi:hypothetical protein
MPDEVQRICNQRQFIDLIRLQCFAESVRLGAEKNLYVMGAFWMELWPRKIISGMNMMWLFSTV